MFRASAFFLKPYIYSNVDFYRFRLSSCYAAIDCSNCCVCVLFILTTNVLARSERKVIYEVLKNGRNEEKHAEVSGI
jgi:hypothetical protein